jgi:hypothetical protein
MVRASALIVSFFVVASAALAADSQVELAPDASAVASCQRLGEVRGSSLMGGLLASAAYNRALAQMKSRAAKLGATHVVLLNGTSGMGGSNMLGVAYKCSAAPAGAN